MTRVVTDIVVSGGGIAGLTAAAAFGSAGFSVICVDPEPPVTTRDAAGADLRSTAILQPSVPVLEAAGLWAALAPNAAPLQVMRIIEAGGETLRSHDFDAADISEAPFGWNLPNWLIRRELVARLAELPTVDFRPGTATTRIATREAEALITLDDGTRVSARLVIAADGRASRIRDSLGIGVQTRRYGQKALAFAVTHPIPHHDISTEVHRTGGPFTLVPLPDHQGLPSSAVVWMEPGAEILRLADLPEAEFEAAMSNRSAHVLGPLTLASRRTVWPIITQVADRMAGERCALLAEAAHVLPPIGAQGLNLSLADIGCLLGLTQADRAGLGGVAMLDAYHRARHWQVQARALGVDALNRASMAGAAPLRAMRGAALGLLHDLAPLRRTAMRAGLGAR